VMRKWKDVIVCLVCDEEMERQLEEQTSKRRELEITLKLLEKDAWAKQATVGALRKQLEDIKIINQDIGNKIRVRENADTFSSMYLLY